MTEAIHEMAGLLAQYAEGENHDSEGYKALLDLAERHRRHGVHPQDPVREVLSITGNKWSTLIIEILGTGSYRYSALRRVVSLLSCEKTISARILTFNLRNLEMNGFVARAVLPTIPPHVLYRLTPLGCSLRQVIGTLVGWGEAHYEEILEARRHFQANHDEDC